MSPPVRHQPPATGLLGAAPDIRAGVRGVLFSFNTYLVYGLITALQMVLGLVTPTAAVWLVAASLAINVLFYALVRSGWSGRTRDPGLRRTQLVVGVGFMYASYAVQGPSAPALLIVMASHIVYGIFSMPPRDVWRLVAASLSGLAATMIACHVLEPTRYPFAVQLVAFLYAALVVPLIALLAGRISGMHRRLRSQSRQLQAALAEVRELAARDELTRVHNRHHMVALLQELRHQSSQEGHPLSLVLIDIDHFKQINDQHGHASGDRVLFGFAQLAVAELRSGDRVARWGGEEFLLALPRTRVAQALEVIERLQESLAGHAGAAHLPPGVTVSFSAGVVELRADETLDAAIARADGAMYAAKRAGRARCAVG